MMSRPRGRLEWETYEMVVGKIRDYVVGERFSLSFSGMGEPLLHPHVCKFIHHVSDRAYTSFSTNGAALSEQNVGELIEAGLDAIYLSFNGDEAVLFGKMMGGLNFVQVLKNLRCAVALSQGTRLRVFANISVTKANRHRLAKIEQLLVAEGVSQILFSPCHTRGGNMLDPEVFDTPRVPEEITHCEVLKSTLFIDWRGQVFICDHDIHGENTLGDLVTEPLPVVLERRQRLIENGVNFRICHECNDALKMGVDGEFRQLINGAYGEGRRSPLSQAGVRMDWLYRVYEKEGKGAQLFRVVAEESCRRDLRVHELEAERKAVQAQSLWPALRFEGKVRRWLRRYLP
jgi:MoaA/NifB/PqqE/SkfB family radical SAM enzyme